MKVAAIIKHRFRNFDYRVDIYEIESEDDIQDIRKKIEGELFQNFELIALTERVNERKILT